MCKPSTLRFYSFTAGKFVNWLKENGVNSPEEIEALGKYENRVIGAMEMFPCLPGTMIRQSSAFLFDEMGWPNRPKSKPGYDENAYRPI